MTQLPRMPHSTTLAALPHVKSELPAFSPQQDVIVWVSGSRPTRRYIQALKEPSGAWVLIESHYRGTEMG